MNRTRIPHSSNIASVGYAGDTLEVEFKSGGVYSYAGVEKEVYKEFMAAKFKGEFFHSRIKNMYASKKEGTVAPEPIVTPCYLTLLKVRKAMKATGNPGTGRIPYYLWLATGRPPKDKPSPDRMIYEQCLKLVGEAQTVDALDVAISLAKDRKI